MWSGDQEVLSPFSLYRRVVTTVLVLGLCTQALPYFAELYERSLAGKWFLLFIAVSFPTFLLRGAMPTLLRHPLAPWGVVMGILAALHPAVGVPREEARAAFLSLFVSSYCFWVSIVLLAHADALGTALRAVKLALLLGSLSCLLEFFGLLDFSISFATGRAAGLYVNPNIAAFTLTLGLATVLPHQHQTTRLVSFVLVGSAVLVTWSRSGYLGLAGLFVIGVLTGRVSLGSSSVRMRLSIAMAGAVIAAGIVLGLEALRPASLETAAVQFRRTPFAEEASADRESRFEGWKDAADAFLAKPGFGIGFLGSRSQALRAVGPHNMIATWAAEFGLVGLALLAALGAGIWRRTSEDALLRVGYLLYGSMFSHNILDHPTVWILVSIWTANPLGVTPGVRALGRLAGGVDRRSPSPGPALMNGGSC